MEEMDVETRRQYLAEFDRQHCLATMYFLSTLKQTSSVADLQEEFEDLIQGVTGISNPLLISYFISALRLEIQREMLRLRRPSTLVETFALARACEARGEKTPEIIVPTRQSIALPSVSSPNPFPSPKITTPPLLTKSSPAPSTRSKTLSTPPLAPLSSDSLASIIPSSVPFPDPFPLPKPLPYPPLFHPNQSPSDPPSLPLPPKAPPDPPDPELELAATPDRKNMRSASAASTKDGGPAILLKRRYGTINHYVHVWGVVTCSGDAPVPGEAPHQFPSAAKAGEKVFDEMPRRDMVLWNSMICDLMELEPNSKPTHTSLIHDGLGLNVAASTALADFHCKWGKISDASQVFDDMPHKSIVSFSAMIHGLARNGLYSESLQRFLDMQRPSIHPNSFILVALSIKVTAICVEDESDSSVHNVVNQGIPDEVIEEIKIDLDEFFKFPLKEKEAFASLVVELGKQDYNLVIKVGISLDLYACCGEKWRQFDKGDLIMSDISSTVSKIATSWMKGVVHSLGPVQRADSFYTWSWAFKIDGTPFLVAGGSNVLICVINVGNAEIDKSLVGHGGAAGARDVFIELKANGVEPDPVWSLLESFAEERAIELKEEWQAIPDLILGNYDEGNLVASLLALKLVVNQHATAHDLQQKKHSNSDMNWNKFENQFHLVCQLMIALIAMNHTEFLFIITIQKITGKTVTFCVVTSQQLNYGLGEGQALILTPTREVAQQIKKIMQYMGDYLVGKVHTCVGGARVHENPRIFTTRFYAVVLKPDHVFIMFRRSAPSFDHIERFVLDETEEILSCGFKNQNYEIFQLLSSTYQEGVFHPTRPPDTPEIILNFVKKSMRMLFRIQCISKVTDEELLQLVALEDLTHWPGRHPEDVAWRTLALLNKQCPNHHLEDKVVLKNGALIRSSGGCGYGPNFDHWSHGSYRRAAP